MQPIKHASWLAPRACRNWLATALIALISATLPAAQDTELPRWFGDQFEALTMLVYGVPNSDYVMLAFLCRPGARTVKIYLQDEHSGARKGERLSVDLRAGARQVTFVDKAMVNEDSGGVDFEADLPLDDTLRQMLGSGEPLDVTIKGHTERYAMTGAAEPAARMLATCDAPKPPGDLDVKVINKAKLPLQSLAYSEAGANAFDSDAFGYRPLDADESRVFTIPDGRTICTFDIALLLARDDEECCAQPIPAGTQNLCENSEYVVHD